MSLCSPPQSQYEPADCKICAEKAANSDCVNVVSSAAIKTQALSCIELCCALFSKRSDVRGKKFMVHKFGYPEVLDMRGSTVP